MTLDFRMTAMIATTAAALIAGAPAFAGTCPAGQMGTNALAGAPTMPVAVTDTLIGSVDLEKELGLAGHDLRLRRLTLKPNGIVPLHSHAGRPALITIVSGEVTEYPTTCKVGIVHKAGDVSPESNGLSHWWKNTGKTTAVLLSADAKAR